MEFEPFKYPISKLNELKPVKGRALISEPFMMDEYFKRAVVYLSEHNKEGTVGFVLNKPLDVKLNDILPDLPDFDAAVYLGGPVQPQSLFYIHNRADLLSDSIRIEGDIYWNGDFEQLKAAILSNKIKDSEIKFFLGYSGWEVGQLEEEIKENSWLVQEIETQRIFEDDDEMWKSIIRESDSRIAPMAEFPEDPTLN